ncbi:MULTISPECIES: protein kinase domain-containing protein [unclassified Streptomyces]|uniref:protein kinase domain-containing protein n=1 Tax=unclassified Streptomyces TaxID=2593676 RepID=UPI000966DE93|nr:protein kinase [Streptomyces sp. TSRI0107]OKJ88307.1 hypothetical protein AMK31_07195 [Streptomyces sp. TSRI0107]
MACDEGRGWAETTIAGLQVRADGPLGCVFGDGRASSNIIVRSSGEVTVVDLGITRSSDARHDITTTGVLIGTPANMAPEALCGTFDCRTDMYSLGCVLYEMVTGQRTSTGTSWYLVNQRLNQQPAPLCALRPDAPAELERLAGWLMSEDPAQRARHGGRPPVITDDMLHTVLRRRANGETVSRSGPS